MEPGAHGPVSTKNGRPSSRRHRVLWAVTCLFIFDFIGLSSYLFFKSPSHIEDQSYWSALKDIGPAIGASWVFSAALLTITAAGITAIESLKDSESRSEARTRAIRRVCIGEIKAFWDRCNSLELDRKLSDHTAWLKDPNGSLDNLQLFRRHLGDDWFVFFRVDPEALGELDQETSAQYISVSARSRHFVSRLKLDELSAMGS